MRTRHIKQWLVGRFQYASMSRPKIACVLYDSDVARDLLPPSMLEVRCVAATSRADALALFRDWLTHGSTAC